LAIFWSNGLVGALITAGLALLFWPLIVDAVHRLRGGSSFSRR
jgi:hypothetical protein